MNLSGSWQYIQDVARNRLANNKTSHHITQYGDGIEVLGVAGEICARRFLGLPEEVHEHFDGGADFVFGNKRVDVKATVLTPRIGYRYLQWPTWKKIRSDLIVLTAIDPTRKIGTVIGYATKAEVMAAPVNDTRDMPCHEIPLRDLHPMWELVSLHLQGLCNEWQT